VNKIAIGSANSETDIQGFQGLSDVLGTEAVAINYFERASGESIGNCYHRHHEQEEVFYVLSGRATFETEDGDVTVDEGELIRFGPGEWQQGWNYESARLQVLALGAPRDQGPTDLRRRCSTCGKRTPALVDERDGVVVYRCEDCGMETGQAT